MVTFELWQHGIPVASVSADDRAAAEVEIGHYALMYGQDGPVEIREAEEDMDQRAALAKALGESGEQEDGR